MIDDEADEVISELFGSLKNRYQNNLEYMKGSEFVFNHAHLLYFKWEGIHFPSENDDWKKWTKMRKIIKQLLSMFCMLKKEKIYPAYVWKHNSNCEKQVILSMILKGEGWHQHYHQHY